MDDPAAAEPFDESLHAETVGVFRSPPPLSVPALVTVLLVILFAASSFGQLRSPLGVLLLVAVILFHEAGHALGMRLFGFRDVKMFFIPFFGAAVTGRPRGAAPWKDALVSLLGPLPGLLLAVAIFVVGPSEREPAEWWFQAATTLLLLNAFNLLPLGFLDGGRFFQRAVFARHPVLAVAFEALGSLALGAVAVALKMYLLGFVVLLSLRGLPRRWRLLAGAARFRAEHPQASADPERIGDEDARALYVATREAIGYPANESAPSIAGAMEEMLDASQRSPGLFASLGLLALYLFALLCVFLGFGFHAAEMGPEDWRWIRAGVFEVEFPGMAFASSGATAGAPRDTIWRYTMRGVERFTAENLAGDTSAAAADARAAVLARESQLPLAGSRPVVVTSASDTLTGTEYRFTSGRRELLVRTFVIAGRRCWLSASAPTIGARQLRFLGSVRAAAASPRANPASPARLPRP